MKPKHILSIALCCACLLPIQAQTTREEMKANPAQTGGVYLAYPTDIPAQTPAPKGYKPFYISHYGRHGSRYLIGDRDYKWVLDLFAAAHRSAALTPLGEDVYGRLQQVWAEAEGHGGDLSPLGVRQHRGIAERMFRSFPEVFEGTPAISARSTVVLRCAMSMVAFGDRLKELNPGLRISYEASQKYMDYLNYHSEESNRFTSLTDGPCAEEYRKFKEERTRPDRLVASLFSNADFIRKQVNPGELMWGLYWIASDMQNMETPLSFYDLFEPDELFALWETFNYHFYIGNANHADGHNLVIDNAKPLLKNILDSADEAIANGGTAATLRFGHDGNVIPLVALMQIENFGVSTADADSLYTLWTDFKVVPMAGNLQLIFFRNTKKGQEDDILVKILHNEREVHIPLATDRFPYYRWADVEAFYRQVLGN